MTSNRKLYLVYGGDELSVSEASRKLADQLVPEADRAFGMEYIDGNVTTVDDAVRAIQQTIEAARTQSFLGGGKTVWLRDPSFFGDSKRLGDAESLRPAIQALVDAIPRIPGGHTILISGSEISGATSFVKSCAKLESEGVAKVEKFAPAASWNEERDAVAFLQEESERLSSPLSHETVAAMVEQIGSNKRLLASELEKLLLYCDGRAPTPKDVSEICSAMKGFARWDLTDAFGSRDLRNTLKIYRKLILDKKNNNAVSISVMLLSRLNELILVHDCLARKYLALGSYPNGFVWTPALPDGLTDSARSADGLLKITAMKNKPAMKLAGQCQRWTRMQLRKARHLILEAYMKAVTLSIPDVSVLETAIIDAMR